MLEEITPYFRDHWPVFASVFALAYLLSHYFKHGLNKYPGPFTATLTDWWRFFDVYKRRPDITHLRLHRQYGDIVRLGPDTLSFASPTAVKQIYGLNKGMVKVHGKLVHGEQQLTDLVWFLSCSASSQQWQEIAFPLFHDRRDLPCQFETLCQRCFLHERSRPV